MKPTDMKPANFEALINTIAANHGLTANRDAALSATARRKPWLDRDEEENLLQTEEAAQGEPPLQLADSGAVLSDAPLQLAQAEAAAGAAVAGEAATGAVAVEAAGATVAGTAAAGTAGAVAGGIGLGGLALGALGAVAVGGLAVAAGGGGSDAAPAVAPAGDTTAPTVSSVAITSAAGAQNSTLNAGDVVSVTVTMSEATTVTGTPQLALNIGGTTVQADYASGSGSTELVFNYTILAGQTDADGIGIAADSLALNSGTLQDAAGNVATLTHVAVADNGGYLVDTTAPTFTSGTTASVAENVATSTTVYDATADGDSGVSYTLGGTDAGLFDIDAGTGAVTFITSPNYEAPADSGGNNVYDITVTATDTAGNSADQGVAITVTDVSESSYTPGDAVIDLGSYGKLIAPVQVEGNWYYYWDRSGDGTNANSGSLNGGQDYTTHDVLDGIFVNDISGTANTTVTNGDGNYGTTDTYRYATLNGVALALPTANGGSAYPNGIGNYQPGTAVDDGATTNPTYDDLLAIWDAHNGSGTGTNSSGTPSGWRGDYYWSATPSGNGHDSVDLSNGYVNDYHDTSGTCVALQVLRVVFPPEQPAP